MATVNITVNKDTKIGASLIEIARNLSRQYKSVVVHDEISEEAWLVEEMKKSRKTGKGNKKKVIEFLSE